MLIPVGNTNGLLGSEFARVVPARFEVHLRTSYDRVFAERKTRKNQEENKSGCKGQNQAAG